MIAYSTKEWRRARGSLSDFRGLLEGVSELDEDRLTPIRSEQFNTNRNHFGEAADSCIPGR